MVFMNIVNGIPVSNGCRKGRLFIIPDRNETEISKNSIKPSEIEPQWNLFLNAVQQVKNDLQSMSESDNPDEKKIFESYKMMLEDQVFIDEIKKEFTSRLLNISYIVLTKYRKSAEMLIAANNDYLKQRADDICDVYGRVVQILNGSEKHNFDNIPQNAVVFAKNLQPTDAVALEKKQPLAVILQEGGPNSHFAILIRNYGIPAVFGLSDFPKSAAMNDEVIVDGAKGIVILDPDKATLEEYSKKEQQELSQSRRLSALKKQPAKTKDGFIVSLFANISSPEEAQTALKQGADGIGLFRTEFLFIKENRLLTEEEQFLAYKSVLQTMKDKPVTIRTLDIGADKIIENADYKGLDEENPLLGWRGIRFCLDNKELFITQLRALYRASVYGKLKIMFPMITSCDEVEIILKLVKTVKASLKKEGLPFAEDVPLGVMIETPSAAIVSDFLAKKCSFFSIGTNDLTQYSLSVDRDNNKVSSLYAETHPAVLRLINTTVKNAKKRRIPVSVCGEFASRPEGLMLLAGMGIDQLSMSCAMIPATKDILSRYTATELEQIAKKALRTNTASKINEELKRKLDK